MVSQNNEEVVKFLHKKKFKEFVYISAHHSTASSTIERINGYNHGLIKYYGASNAKNLLKFSANKSPQTDRIKSYLKAHPETEVLIFTGPLLPQVMEALAQSGLSTPNDIKLMIFDDELTITEKKLLRPYLIKQDGAGIGTAAKLLYDQMYSSSKPTTKLFHIVIDDSYCN